MPKIIFLHGCYLVLRSRSGSRLNFWRAAFDNRFSALPSAAKSNKSHFQFKVFVFVSLISGRMRISARMRSIGVLIYLELVKLYVSRMGKQVRAHYLLITGICRL